MESLVRQAFVRYGFSTMLGQKEMTKEQAREGRWKEQMLLLAGERDLACMWLHA